MKNQYLITGGCFALAAGVILLHFFQSGLSPLNEAISYYVHGSPGWCIFRSNVPPYSGVMGATNSGAFLLFRSSPISYIF